MTCEEVRDELVAYARGELSPERKAKVEEHLVRCAGCSKELEGARRVMALAQVADELSTARLANQLFAAALTSGASDIHLERVGADVRTRLRIDGVLREGPVITKDQYDPLVARMKLLGGMNLAERGVPQDGRIPYYNYEGKDYDFRIAVYPTIVGEGVVIRILDHSSVMIGLERLGLLPEMLEQIEAQAARPRGIFLVVGPTGCGKTTTLYSMLKRINSPERKIQTIEDPVEYQLPGVNQLTVNQRAGLTFATALRAFMRHDPDVLLVGAIRDLEVAEGCASAALTGHLVLTVLHTNDAPSALTRLVDMGLEPFVVAASVNAVLAQRLVRKVCAECKTEYAPPPEALAYLGVNPEPGAPPATFYRGAGCEKCRHTGYRGRTGIYELLVMDERIKDLVVRRAPLCEIREAARAAGMRSLKEDGLGKAREGITTVEEVFRAVAQA
ncbi:MAG: Flp pilus assembly complex ATPase component TadA [Armatimonadetes bacterium]|nr:Flp pilus assembly complex ATPase component TadA [Armatimonadota bacterium]